MIVYLLLTHLTLTCYVLFAIFEYRAKICRGEHCNCRKDVHFRRRLQYCFQEVEAALDDKVRIRSDLKMAKQRLKQVTTEESLLKVRRERLAKRVSTVSTNANAALNSSQRQRAYSSKHSTPVKKRVATTPYEGVGEAARRSTASASVSVVDLVDRSVVGAPDRKNTSPARSDHSSPHRGHSPYRSPLRVSSSSRKGVLHSMDSAVSHHNRLRHSHNAADEDLSHWDLKHLQVQAPDLTQYDSLEF
jgi:hypothetical protein